MVWEDKHNPSLEVAKTYLLEHGRLIDSDAEVPKLFGFKSLPGMFKDLVDDWQGRYPGVEPYWLDAVCQQLMYAAKDKDMEQKVTPALFREISGMRQYVPILGHVRSTPGEGKMQFDVFFYYDSKAMPVTGRMNRMKRVYCLNLFKNQPDQYLLKELLEDLRENDWHRVPVLGENNGLCISST